MFNLTIILSFILALLKLFGILSILNMLIIHSLYMKIAYKCIKYTETCNE